MRGNMELTIIEKDNIQIVSIKGRMDTFSAPLFDNKISETIDAGKSRFIVNFSKLEYISSAGLRSILLMAKKLKSSNGKVHLTELTGSVKEVFEISGFGVIFQIFETEAQALAALKEII